jgi:hypothetical protein
MAIPTVLTAMPEHSKQGFKYIAAISYKDGEVRNLYGCSTAKEAMIVAKTWISARRKGNEICKDILLRE